MGWTQSQGLKSWRRQECPECWGQGSLGGFWEMVLSRGGRGVGEEHLCFGELWGWGRQRLGVGISVAVATR